MQSLPLEAKVAMTKNRIRWFLNEHDAYVCFSGGKDSTVLLHIAREMYSNIPAVFVDTGLEYPEIREFVKTIPNVTWLRPDMNFRKVIETYGYPIVSKLIAGYIASAKKNPNCIRAKFLKGEIDNKMYGGNGKWGYLIDAPFKVSDYCCKKMKKQPSQRFARETGLRPILATMACESQNRKQSWLKNGCNIYDGKEPKSQPMSFWTEQDVLEYLKKYNIPYASVYGEIVEDKDGKLHTTGCDRTGCVFCGFGCHLEKEPNRFQRLKQTHPKLYDYCMKPTTEHGLGYKEIFDYMNEHGMNIKYE